MEKSFEYVRQRLRNLDLQRLPGAKFQYQMAPPGRGETPIKEPDLKRVKRAAVLMPIMNNDDSPELILMQRAEYPGVHSGQISLPGGKREKSDQSFEETALRETEEEIGVPASEIELIGGLSPLYIPPSNFLVNPFIGTLQKKTSFKIDNTEVQRIIKVDLNVLFHPSSSVYHFVQSGNNRLKVPAFRVDDHIIWGATAMMLSELRALLD